MTAKDDQKWIISKASALIGGLIAVILALVIYIFSSSEAKEAASFAEVKSSIKNIERNTKDLPAMYVRVANNEKVNDKQDIELAYLKKKLNDCTLSIESLKSNIGNN